MVKIHTHHLHKTMRFLLVTMTYLMVSWSTMVPYKQVPFLGVMPLGLIGALVAIVPLYILRSTTVHMHQLLR